MVSPAGSESSLFNRLPARPPTPPKDVESDVDFEPSLRFLRDGHEDPATKPTKKDSGAAARPSTDTPPPRKSSVASLQQRDSGTKKVDFSPHPTYHKIPQLGQSSSPDTRLQRLTPVRRGTKPLKSILKAAADRLPPTPDDLKISPFSPEEPGSFRKMMQSVLRQLASPARDDRRDAYLALNNALKTHQGVPEPDAIVDKIELLQQFLSRDMAWKDGQGRLDSNIVTQALQLTMALLFNATAAAAFDDDFRSYLLDRSISVLEQPDVAKSIVKSHVHLVGAQRFRSHIMTAARADKLIHFLRGLEDRCSGNSIIATRLIAYRNLSEQAPATMLSRMRDWIDYVCHGMLSSIPEIRIRAIEACSQAAVLLGSQAQAAKIILETMDAAGEDEQSYGDFFISRLGEMITKDKQTAMIVPQIWSAVILFFRCKRRPVDKWPKFRDWLLILQRCLNHSELEVKYHANIAWNKLVYAILPDGDTAETMRSMLRVPITAALDKRGNDKPSQQQRQIALDSYCNLLHYGLRPGLSNEVVDKAWDLYVDPVLTNMAESRSKGQRTACRIIYGLLKRSPGVWNADAALESKTIQPEELPRLEPRWLRSRLGRVIKVIEPIILTSMRSSPDANKPVSICWRLLLQAISEAGAQEVKTTNELKDAIAQLTNLFRRIWFAGSKPERSQSEVSDWIHRYQELLEVAVDTLGPGPFVEDILAKTKEDEVEAAPTPSQRSAKHPASAYPSFVFLFALYYHPHQDLKTSGRYKDSATWFIRLLASSKGSASGSLGLLHRCLKFSSNVSAIAADAEGRSEIWSAVAENAIEILEAQASSAPQPGVQVTGNALRSALDILNFGLRYATSSPHCLSQAINLYFTACETARHCGSSGGVALGVMEPMAKSLTDTLDDMPIAVALAMGEAMATHGVWPETRQELEKSRKALWVISLELPRTSHFDPFDHVYGCLRAILTRAYGQLQKDEIKATHQVDNFFASLTKFAQKCPKSILPTALRQIQGGLVDWIEDRQRQVFPLSGAKAVLSPDAILRSVSDLLQLVKSLPRKDSALLQSIEPLLIACLTSPGKDVVNMTIDFWNATFGEEMDLEYPSRIQPVLRARRDEVHLDLPNFPDDVDGMKTPSFPAFAESQFAPMPMLGFGSLGPLVAAEMKKNSPHENIYIKQHLAAQGLPYDPKPPKGTPAKTTTPKRRLRHDNSQVDFAPIESPAIASSNESSQLLTEHQKEVQARQKGDAQMFPEISSSPAQPTGKSSIAKKLDFSSETGRNAGGDGAVSTPTGLQEGNPMSDDLPSSPTPRATNTALQKSGIAEYSDDEETICDPPSSPPRHEDRLPNIRRTHPDDTTVVESTFIEENSVDRPEAPGPSDSDVRGTAIVDGSDLPSDTLLPTAQLERETAAVTAETEVDAVDVEDAAQPEMLRSQQEVKRQSRHLQTPSRIQDSMIELEAQLVSTPSEGPDTPKSSRGSKKRKRNGESGRSSKKRGKSSPLKHWWDKVVGQNQDEDIEDEIVVASSQPRSSPLKEHITDDISSEPERKLSRPNEDDTNDKQEPPIKRKAGRPRKSASQGPTRPEQTTTKDLKRRASVLSNNEEYSSTSVVQDTPAPVKATKRKSSRLSEAAVDAGSSSRRLVLGVMPSPPDRVTSTQDLDEVHEEENDESTTPAKQLEAEQAQAIAERPILQPKSILSRLRDVLGDCKKMVFGSQEEEREFDDVLFEIRREVHDAGRRQRDGGE